MCCNQKSVHDQWRAMTGTQKDQEKTGAVPSTPVHPIPHKSACLLEVNRGQLVSTPFNHRITIDRHSWFITMLDARRLSCANIIKYINTMPRQIGGSKKCLRCIVMSCRFTLDKPLHHLATATSHQICWKVSEHQTGKVQSFSALCLDKSGLQIWSTAGTWMWQSIWLSIPLRWMQKGRNIYCIIINIYIIIYSIAMLSVYLSCMCAYQLIIVYNIV